MYMCNAPWARKFYFNVIFIRDPIKIKMPADWIQFVMVIDPGDIIELTTYSIGKYVWNFVKIERFGLKGMKVLYDLLPDPLILFGMLPKEEGDLIKG